MLVITLTSSSFLPEETPGSSPHARVWFYGAKMNYDTLNSYRNNQEFDHFVFQPMMRDADDRRDYYYLVCYAVKANGDVMKNGEPIDLEVLYNIHLQIVNKLSLANIKVTRAHINFLYNDGGRGDLNLTPEKYPRKPDYISCRLETTARILTSSGTKGTSTNTLASLLVNPSPPAQPSEN